MEKIAACHVGRKAWAQRGQTYVFDVMYAVAQAIIPTVKTVAGMAIIHQGTSYCLSNQFTVQEVDSRVRVHSSAHSAYSFFFMVGQHLLSLGS